MHSNRAQLGRYYVLPSSRLQPSTTLHRSSKRSEQQTKNPNVPPAFNESAQPPVAAGRFAWKEASSLPLSCGESKRGGLAHARNCMHRRQGDRPCQRDPSSGPTSKRCESDETRGLGIFILTVGKPDGLPTPFPLHGNQTWKYAAESKSTRGNIADRCHPQPTTQPLIRALGFVIRVGISMATSKIHFRLPVCGRLRPLRRHSRTR
jgi:hypothetical protein